MAIEIVDFPIKNGDFPLLFVCSPEGSLWFFPSNLELKGRKGLPYAKV